MAGQQVLVTGADGFIGSHLVQRLLADGARVRALCVYTSSGSLGWLEELTEEERDNVDVRLGDVRDAELVADLVRGCDVVLHLAALIAIPYSYQAPRSFVETNVTGTLNVLEAVRRSGSARLVHTSTSEVYGTPEQVPIRETHPLHGQSPYSASKIGADMLCEAYARSFEVPVTVLRPFNTFGPRQSARAVIPTVLQQMLAGAKTIRLGSLRPRRDFTYVADTCDGFVRAASAELPAGSLVQLGTGRDVSIGELVEMCRAVTQSDAVVETDDERVRPEGSEVERLLSDPTRARELLGWEPTVGLEEGLARTAQWLAARPLDPRSAARYQR
nr:SDR family NAD(P)-dependent oxidoreductase [Motilibacter deserti]